MKIVIIDDEVRARRIMKTLLEEHCPFVEICDMAENVPAGVKAIQKHQPDLVFLDIEMPEYSGFQLLDFFDKIDFEIVFATAYNNYALKAFQVSAIGYLLKPIEIDALVKIVEKVKSIKSPTPIQERLGVLKANLEHNGRMKKIGLPTSEGLVFVQTEAIMYLKAQGAYTEILLLDKPKILVAKNIKQLEESLIHPNFFRTHRSFLVNLSHVQRFIRKDGGYLIMEDGQKIPLSARNKQTFLTAFQQL